MRSAPTITFEAPPSRWLMGALAIVMVLALVAIASAGIAPEVRLSLAVMVAVYGASNLTALVRRPVVQLMWSPDGWSMRRDAHADFEMVDVRMRQIGPALFITCRRAGERRLTVALLPDNASAVVRRRLRMHMTAMTDA